MNVNSGILVVFAAFILVIGFVYGISPPDISDLNKSPKNVSLKYIIYGHHDEINLTVYSGAYDYFTNRDTHIYSGLEDTTYIEVTNNNIQKAYFEPLFEELKSKTNNTEEQARIVINLVQRLNYTDDNSNELQYPYEVLYNGGGVCSGKSMLLAYLLKEIGYGVALLGFDEENHMVVGIKTSDEFSYKNTGYALIETTRPEIITHSNGLYTNPDMANATPVSLTSQPEVIVISRGMTFTNLTNDYLDAKQHERFSNTANVSLSPIEYARWKYLVWYYGLEFGSTGEFLVTDPELEPICENGTYCNNICWEACKEGTTPICEEDGVYCENSNLFLEDKENTKLVVVTALLLGAMFWLMYEAYLK